MRLRRTAVGATHDAEDLDLGRVPGLLPPVGAVTPWLWLLSLLAVLSVVVIALVRPPGPLDQADLAYQRDGLLDDGPVVEQDVAGVRLGDRVVVLVFDRQAPSPQALRRWTGELTDGRDVRLVLPAPAPGSPVPVVVDPAGRLARAVDLPTPNDGGRGIGYAVIDASRTVRYSTLDPAWLSNAFEVATIATSVDRAGAAT